MERLHIIVGWGSLVVFLATGAWLRWIFPEAYASDDAIRYLYRANHVYILFSALLNILAGHLVVSPRTALFIRLRSIGSALLLLAPGLLLAAFILETSPADPMRPLTVTGAFFALFGALLLDRARRERLL